MLSFSAPRRCRGAQSCVRERENQTPPPGQEKNYIDQSLLKCPQILDFVWFMLFVGRSIQVPFRKKHPTDRLREDPYVILIPLSLRREMRWPSRSRISGQHKSGGLGVNVMVVGKRWVTAGGRRMALGVGFFYNLKCVPVRPERAAEALPTSEMMACLPPFSRNQQAARTLGAMLPSGNSPAAR